MSAKSKEIVYFVLWLEIGGTLVWPVEVKFKVAATAGQILEEAGIEFNNNRQVMMYRDQNALIEVPVDLSRTYESGTLFVILNMDLYNYGLPVEE